MRLDGRRMRWGRAGVAGMARLPAGAERGRNRRGGSAARGASGAGYYETGAGPWLVLLVCVGTAPPYGGRRPDGGKMVFPRSRLGRG